MTDERQKLLNYMDKKKEDYLDYILSSAECAECGTIVEGYFYRETKPNLFEYTRAHRAYVRHCEKCSTPTYIIRILKNSV